MAQLTVVAVALVLVVQPDGALVRVANPWEGNRKPAFDLLEALPPVYDGSDAAPDAICIQPAPLAPAPLAPDMTLEQLVASCVRGIWQATGGR